MPKIIISYRRADTQDITMRVRDRLRKRYGAKSVFTDIDSIPIGSDFLRYIDSEIATADALLAIVGPRWLRTDRNDSSNLDDETDYVRLEVEAALKQNVKVAPILVGGARMPRTAELPAAIKEFAKLNAAPVDSGINFENDLDRLIASLDEHFEVRSSSHADVRSPSNKSSIQTQLGASDEATGDRPTSFVAALKAAYQRVPALGFSIGVACIATFAAIGLGFIGHARASLVIFSGIVIAAILVSICTKLVLHRSLAVVHAGFAAIWAITLIFVVFLAVTATASGFKWPAIWATALGFEIEDAICSDRRATQEVYSCNAAGDWVVVGIDLRDSDGVWLNIRDNPTVDGFSLHTIPPNGTDLSVDQCDGAWCHVGCDGIAGWSKQRFLKPRSAQLRELVANNEGELTVQAGPHRTCGKRGSIQNGRKVILHGCERNAEQAEWCRITYNGISGWIPASKLNR
jgi:SH3-like domain-containing protein